MDESYGEALRAIAREHTVEGTALHDALMLIARRLDSLELRAQRLELEVVPREVSAE